MHDVSYFCNNEIIFGKGSILTTAINYTWSCQKAFHFKAYVHTCMH